MEKQIIIGLSGKKQSGKDTMAKCIEDQFDCSTKIYSFADSLKQKVCIDVLGLTYKQCYGSDDDKNSLTEYRWDSFPYNMRINHLIEKKYVDGTRNIYPSGRMTAREIMQIVGTDVFRKYFGEEVWVNATFQQIKKDKIDLCLISDVRFPSEVESIIKNGGWVIRLTRNIFGEDVHESETALDNYDFKSNPDCYIFDNKDLNVEAQNEKTFNIVKRYYSEEIKCR